MPWSCWRGLASPRQSGRPARWWLLSAELRQLASRLCSAISREAPRSTLPREWLNHSSRLADRLSGELGFGNLEVTGHHEPDQISEADLGRPAQVTPRLACVPLQVVDFGRAQVAWI